MTFFKRICAVLPARVQFELKRIHYARQIHKGTFTTTEPEYAILPELLNTGDWVIDVGANVGHYTKRFSELVGTTGRVIAFEPVPTTLSLLAANANLFSYANVTMINAAVSNKTSLAGISIPQFSNGLSNYYEAHLTSVLNGELRVLTVSIDSLCLNQKIALVKIDAEGHEAFVLNGMQQVLERDRPVLIVETCSQEVTDYLRALGYATRKMPDSPNIIFRPTLRSDLC